MTVRVYTAERITVPPAQIGRYLGARWDRLPEELRGEIERVGAEASRLCGTRVCYLTLPLQIDAPELRFSDALALRSESLCRCLAGCGAAVLFCATAGAGIDRRIAASRLRPARQAIWDAAGAAAVEALCDDFCASLGPARERFSPGYGDLPLESQSELLRLLDARRLLGVGLTDALLMTPSKSVTAIVGLEETI